jgi:hypothetical protein
VHFLASGAFTNLLSRAQTVMEQAQKRRQIGGDRVSPASQKRTCDREAQILELRLRKIPFEKIGQTLGITKSAAHKAYHRALHRVPVRRAKEMVVEELEALDRLESRLWRELERPGIEVKAVSLLTARLLDIQRRRAKLLGLDATQQIDVSVLKPDTDSNDRTICKEQAMIERLSPSEKRDFLALLSKMSEDRNGVPDTLHAKNGRAAKPADSADSV